MTADDLFFSILSTNPGYEASWAQSSGTDYRGYIEQGARPVLVSDYCGGYQSPVHPLHSLTRACNELSAGGEANPGQAIDFETALCMWTRWAAQSTLQYADRGSILAGKLGDFALLSGNPERLPRERLMDLRVDATILGGLVVFER